MDTFAGCKVDKPGTYTLTAAASGLTSATSTSFTITVGTASQLAFTTNPSNSTIGTAFATQPVVTVRDAGGNTVTTSTASVTLTLTTPAGATLTCTTNPQAASAGVDTFAGCAVNNSGTYTLTAVASGLSSATSTSFTISGIATKLVFTNAPITGPKSDNNFPVANLGPFTAQLQDASGNPVLAPAGGTVVNLAATIVGSPTNVLAATLNGPMPGVTSVTIPAEASSVNFYFGTSKPQGQTITVSSTGLTSASQFVTVN